MKKIFTLLAAVVLFTAANAQNANRDNRQNNGNGYNNNTRPADNRYDRDDHYRNSRFEMEHRRDMEIARINREYNYKIQTVRNSFFMGRFEKMRRIHFLEEQRDREIRKVYVDYRYDDHHDRDGHDRH